MEIQKFIDTSIINTDKFYDMSITTQALFLHLLVNARPSGFISNPRAIARAVGVRESEIQTLIKNRYLCVDDEGNIGIRYLVKIYADKLIAEKEKEKEYKKKNKEK